MSALRIPAPLVVAAKWVGYPLFAFGVFLLSLYYTLPRERIKERLETEASNFLGADVKASDDFGLTLFSGAGFTTSEAILKTRPLSANDKPQRIAVDDLTIHFSVLQLSRGFADTWFSGKIGKSGEVSGKFKSVPDEGELAIDASGLSLGDVPAISAAAGLPIEATIEVKADLTAPKNLVSQANGSATLTLTDVSVGDGKTLFKIQSGDPFLSQGITVPKIALGRITGSVSVEKGRATVHELRGHSKDIDVELDGTIDLRDPISLSIVHLYLKVKPSEALIKREAALELVLNGAAAAKRNDGYLGFSIAGTAGSPVFLPAREAPAGLGPQPPPLMSRTNGMPPSMPPSPRYGAGRSPTLTATAANSANTVMIDVPAAPPPPLPSPPPPLPPPPTAETTAAAVANAPTPLPPNAATTPPVYNAVPTSAMRYMGGSGGGGRSALEAAAHPDENPPPPEAPPSTDPPIP